MYFLVVRDRENRYNGCINFTVGFEYPLYFVFPFYQKTSDMPLVFWRFAEKTASIFKGGLQNEQKMAGTVNGGRERGASGISPKWELEGGV